MKIYNLYVNGTFQICHHDLNKIDKEKTHVVACWNNAQKYGCQYWTDKPFPTFEIR